LLLAFEITYRAEEKINFACHLKAWRAWIYYISMQFDIQYGIEVSVECDVPAALTSSTLPGSKSYTYFLTGKLGGWQCLFRDFG
jgi:hypothetical protein